MLKPLTSTLPAMAADAVCLLVFAAVGRSSHHEHNDVVGVLATASPFLAGAAAGWASARGWRGSKALEPTAIVPTGVSVWLGAVGIGMLLRWLTGQGVAWSFVVVASVVTALFLLGWRLAAQALAARSRR